MRTLSPVFPRPPPSDFAECMRSLGYPRIISMENFRNPNFELVADCLDWLVSRYDETANIDDDISTESDRVFFLKAVAQVFMSKARIKLNLKRLYAADGCAARLSPLRVPNLRPRSPSRSSDPSRSSCLPRRARRRLAVKELLKIANLLYQATAQADDAENEPPDVVDASGAKTFDVKLTRQLASEITRRGAEMHDALGEEQELRDARLRAINRNMDVQDIEQQVHEQIVAVRDNVENVERALANLDKDEKSLEGKIEKRRAELERSEKRLSTLKSVRPAYMDEYERLQEGLQDLYVAYLERHRNLAYLESELDAHRAEEDERSRERDAAMQKMQRRLREEELKVLRGEERVDEAEEFDEEEFDAKHSPGMSAKTSGAGAAAGARAAGKRFGLGGGVVGGARKPEAVVGSMMGGDEDDDFSDGSSDDGIRDEDGGSSSDDNDF